MRPSIQTGSDTVGRAGVTHTGDEEGSDQGEQYQVSEYYEYLLIHIDNLMVIRCRPEATMHLITSVYKIK